MTSVDGQMVLEEEIDENYEPTDQEIAEYAGWLGMDVDKEKELLWVAREGLKAPLPEQWKPCKTPAGDIYYFNFGSGESIWDHPCDEFYRKLYQEEKKKASQPPTSPLNRSMPKGPSPLGAGQQKPRAMASPSISLHSSLEIMPAATAGKESPGPRPLGALKPLGSSMEGSPLAAVKVLSPLSGSGTDFKTLMSNQSKPFDASLSRSMDDDDREARSSYRAKLGEERQAWERRAQSEYEEERDDLERQYKKRIDQLRQDLEGDESAQKRKMLDATEMVVSEYKRQMEAREAREKEEVNLDHKRKMNDFEEEQAVAMAKHKKELEEAEEKLKEQVATAKKTFDESDLVKDGDVVTARERALDRVIEEAVAWAETQKVSIREEKLNEAVKQVENEVAPVRNARREAAMAQALEATSSAMDGLKKDLEEKRLQLEKIGTEISFKKQQLVDLEAKVSDKLASSSAAEVEVKVRETQASGAESEVRAKQAELADINQRLLSKMEEHDDIEAKVRAKQVEATEADVAVRNNKQKLDEITQDIEKSQKELYAAQQRLATQAAYGSGLSDAELAIREAAMKESKKDLEELQNVLASLKAQVTAKQGELAALASEVGRRRAEALTRDFSMAQELRTKADEEYQRIESELRFTKSELARVSPQLTAASRELELKQNQLKTVTDELADNQKRSIHVGSSLAEETVSLAEVESKLADSRAQLDRVAALLLNTRKELDYESQSKALTSEEKTLLQVQRSRMTRAVEDQIQSEKTQLLKSRMAAVKAEVDKLTLKERSKREAQAAVELAAANHHKVTTLHYDDNNAHSPRELLQPMPTLSPRLPALQIAGSETGRESTAAVLQSPGDLVRTTDPNRSTAFEGASDIAESTDRLQRSLEVLIKQSGGGLGQDVTNWPRYDSAPDTSAPSPGGNPNRHNNLAAFSEEDDTYSLATGRTAIQRQRDDQLGLASNIFEGGSLHDAQLLQPAVMFKAKLFLKQQKRSIRERQAMIETARNDWKTSSSAADSCPDPGVRQQQAAVLRQVKGVLEDQAHRLNADANNLRSLKLQIQALESRVNFDAFSASQGQHGRNPASHANTPRGGAGEAGGGQHATAAALAAVLPLLSQGAGGHQAEHLRESLERISRAVHAAVAQASQSESGGDPARQRYTSAHQPRGGWHSAAEEDDGYYGRGGGGGEGYRRRSSNSGGGNGRRSSHSGMGELDRWREDRGVARTLLHDHSDWLRGFREQIGKVSSGGGGQPSSASYTARPGGGAGGGHPMRMDIGGGQELRIDVRQK